ncbi:hypothetical protein [Nocardia sputi]|uniref:hypothetical protein n=1 Tax=Nocardia sputi TaxID=2943705 RepID=UPI0020BF65C4|nr:hypothetical protein [Nocardia sputi]
MEGRRHPHRQCAAENRARLDLARPRDTLLFHTRNDTPGTAYHFYKNAWQPALRRLEALSRRDFSLFTKKALWRGEDPELLLAYYGSAVNTVR